MNKNPNLIDSTKIVAINAFKKHLHSQVCKYKLVNGS